MSTCTLDPAAAQDDPLLECPTCRLPAQITERFTLRGSPGPVQHVKLACVAGHRYTPPVDQLPALSPEQHRARRCECGACMRLTSTRRRERDVNADGCSGAHSPRSVSSPAGAI
jgi:hypothetical protein